MRKLLFYSLLVMSTVLLSCKNDNEKPDDGKLCLACVGEATICVGDEDEDGDTISESDLQLAYAFLVALEVDCTLD